MDKEHPIWITIPYSDEFLKGVVYFVPSGPTYIRIVSSDTWKGHVNSPERTEITLRDDAGEVLLQKIAEFEKEKLEFEKEKELWRFKTANKMKYSRSARETVIKAGIPMKCKICGYDKSVTVHHIDGNPANNALDNLVVLCWNCHLGSMHNYKLQEKVIDDNNIPSV
jgi:5-methylcytosine-specific restriction endonuclease McrA